MKVLKELPGNGGGLGNDRKSFLRALAHLKPGILFKNLSVMLLSKFKTNFQSVLNSVSGLFELIKRDLKIFFLQFTLLRLKWELKRLQKQQ